MATKYRVVIVSVPSVAEARRIAHKVVEKELAACVSIVPKVRSIYRWEGKVEETQETLLLMKTKKEALSKLTKRIKKMHSYEVPEILALKVDDGDDEYLKWLELSTYNQKSAEPD